MANTTVLCMRASWEAGSEFFVVDTGAKPVAHGIACMFAPLTFLRVLIWPHPSTMVTICARIVLCTTFLDALASEAHLLRDLLEVGLTFWPHVLETPTPSRARPLTTTSSSSFHPDHSRSLP